MEFIFLSMLVSLIVIIITTFPGKTGAEKINPEEKSREGRLKRKATFFAGRNGT
jgi:hypothetical protein